MSRTILIVDDSATMRSALRLYLQGGSFQFVEAESVERAIHLAGEVKLSLAIVDLTMPGLNGAHLMKQLRSRQTSRLAPLPVVLLTGDDSDDGHHHAEAAGADKWIRKPINAGLLRATVESLLAGLDD
jgi:two-component system chemotaxis response regulator CheY